MATPLVSVWNDFVSLIYPRSCEACHQPLVRGEDLFCTGCIRDLPRTGFHLLNDHPLARKFRGRLPVVHALAFLKFRKGGKVQQILHALKYRNRPEIGYQLGLVYGQELVAHGVIRDYEAIVSIPLHTSRLRQRGYNQSDQWASGLSCATTIAFEKDVIRRLKKTRTQTDRTKLSRWENVKEIFEVISPDRIAGKKVLLVDDVVTTGATLEACGQTLLQAGCREIGVACLAAAN